MKKRNIKDLLPILGLFTLVVVNLLLMILINWNWSNSIEDYFSIDKKIDSIYNNTINSKLLLNKVINGDTYIDIQKDIMIPLQHKSLKDYIAKSSKKQSSFEYRDILPYLKKIDVKLSNFHYLAQKRWENYQKYGPKVGELYFDSEYQDIIKLVGISRDKTEEHLAKVLEKKNQYFIFSIILFLLINFIGFIVLLAYKQKKEKYEKFLFEEKEKAIVTLHSIGDGVITTDANGLITLVNGVAEKLTGYNNNEALGKKLEDVFYIVDTKTKNIIENPARKVLEKGKIISLSNHTMLISKKEEKYQISDSAAPIRNEEGKIIGVILVFRDVSKEYVLRERLQKNREELFDANKELLEHQNGLEALVQKRTQKLENSLEKLTKMQEQLIQTEKMVALGELVAGVAHEINTPVGLGITGITHFMDETNKLNDLYKNKQMSQEDFEKYLNDTMNIANILYENLKRAGELVKSFKQISVDQTNEEKREFNLKGYLNNILLSLNNKIKKTNIKVEINCKDEIDIYSYPGAYSQIVTNLIINSLIHAYNDMDKGIISLNFKLLDSTLDFLYKDDGKGISQENLKKIFNPFFTTNREKGGSGLGLNVLYNIITQKLNGTIECKSELGKGVEFHIKVPYKQGEDIGTICYKK